FSQRRPGSGDAGSHRRQRRRRSPLPPRGIPAAQNDLQARRHQVRATGAGVTDSIAVVAVPHESQVLAPATPEVKRFQRQKLWAGLGSLAISVVVAACFAVWAAPRLDPWVTALVGDSRWLRLAAWGFIL